jgi:hypothetical protein
MKLRHPRFCLHAPLMPRSLHETLHGNDIETLLHNARLTRDWPNSDERYDQAQRQVLRAMYQTALGQISHQERNRILEILRPCCPELFAAGDAPQEPDWRFAFEQDMIPNHP